MISFNLTHILGNKMAIKHPPEILEKLFRRRSFLFKDLFISSFLEKMKSNSKNMSPFLPCVFVAS